MHVTIYGAGALGCVYGSHLLSAGVSCTFVTARPRDPRCTVTLERVGTTGVPRTTGPIDWRTEAPKETDLILVTVASDALPAVAATLAARYAKALTKPPVLVLSPMLPALYSALREVLGGRLFGGLPTVIAYHSAASTATNEVYRYWLPPAATRFAVAGKSRAVTEGPGPSERSEEDGRAKTQGQDETADYDATIEAFVAALRKGGVPATTDEGVADKAAAATLSMAPLMIALYIAGSVEKLVADASLRGLAADALRETGALVAAALPKAKSFATGIVPPFVDSSAFGAVVALTKIASPETIVHLNEHFANGKLRKQHLALVTEAQKLAEQHTLKLPALGTLGIRLLTPHVFGSDEVGTKRANAGSERSDDVEVGTKRANPA